MISVHQALVLTTCVLVVVLPMGNTAMEWLALLIVHADQILVFMVNVMSVPTPHKDITVIISLAHIIQIAIQEYVPVESAKLVPNLLQHQDNVMVLNVKLTRNVPH